MWNGVVHGPGAGTTVPAVVVQGKSANPLTPDNLAFPAGHIVFYEKGAASKSLSEEEAVQRYVRSCITPMHYLLHHTTRITSLHNLNNIHPLLCIKCRLVDLSDETRKVVATAIVKGIKLSLTGSAEEAVKI